MIDVNSLKVAKELLERDSKSFWWYEYEGNVKQWKFMYVAKLCANYCNEDMRLLLPWTALKELGTWARKLNCQIWLRVNNEKFEILIYQSSASIEELNSVQL